MWKNGCHFLVMVDAATRFVRASVILNRSPETPITELFVNWISLFGSPKRFLSDNGGESNNDSMRTLADCYGIILVCTADESPCSNGICGRLNGVIGLNVQKVVQESQVDLPAALS